MKLIPRSSDQDHLVQDQHVEAVQTLYIPYTGNSVPSIGGNDEDKIGAIATYDVDGVKFLSVYQGGGVWKDIPYTPAVSNEIKQFRFTRADLTNVADGMGDLILPFTGSQLSQGLISRAEQDVNGVPTGELVANLSGGPVTSYNQIPDVDQYGIVYYVGEAADEPVRTYIIDSNGTTQNTVYRYNNGSDQIFPVGQVVTPTFDVGDILSFDLSTNQYLTFNVRDINTGEITFTDNSYGPITFNGLAMQSGFSYQYLIFETDI